MLHIVDSKGWSEKTAWCVPTAISFLTGIPLLHSHSRAAFIQETKLNDVEGVYASEAALLLREQGYRVRQISLKDKYENAPKLKAFLNNLSGFEKVMPLMIQVEKKPDFVHMVVSHFGFAADNWTMKPVKADEFPHKNAYVTAAWIVEKMKK
jgi:hypothetical protein